MKLLTPEAANLIYDVIAEIGGAHESERANFVYHCSQASDGPPSEWRFCGKLDFGGKVYLDSDRWRTGCYREDDTPERSVLIAEMNMRLELLRRREIARAQPVAHFGCDNCDDTGVVTDGAGEQSRCSYCG
jgi:hypothetical protein